MPPRARPGTFAAHPLPRAALLGLAALTGCGTDEPELWGRVDAVTVTGRVRVIGDVLFVDPICARPSAGAIQELTLEVSREQGGERPASQPLLRLQATANGLPAAYLCVGPTRVPGVQRGQGVQIVARLVAVIGGDRHPFGESFAIE
jgi:hypothetical protein